MAASPYQITDASLSELTRYTVGEPSLSALVQIGVGRDGERNFNITVPVDLKYNGSSTLEQIEEAAFAQAAATLRDIGVPDPTRLLAMYREQYTGGSELGDFTGDAEVGG